MLMACTDGSTLGVSRCVTQKVAWSAGTTCSAAAETAKPGGDSNSDQADHHALF
jgi:hypothetical protein